jgi:hypothetical protein
VLLSAGVSAGGAVTSDFSLVAAGALSVVLAIADGGSVLVDEDSGNAAQPINSALVSAALNRNADNDKSLVICILRRLNSQHLL